MGLTKKQQKVKLENDLSEALCASFLNEDSLGSMVKESIYIRLNEIIQNAESYKTLVSKVVEYASSHGELIALAVGALEQAPKSQRLKIFFQDKLQELLLVGESTLLSDDLLASLIQALKPISGTAEFEKTVLPACTQTLPDMDVSAPTLREQLCNNSLSDSAKWLITLDHFLNNWGRNSDGQLYIVLFVQNLKFLTKGLVQTNLTQWLNDLPESIRPASQLPKQKIYPERPSDEALKKLQAYFLITVEPAETSDSNRYMVNGYVITRLSNEKCFNTIDDISLRVPLPKEINNSSQEPPYYTLEQIENELPEWLRQVMDWIGIRRDEIIDNYNLEFSLPKLPDILTVEFWLPLEHLSVAVESWKIYSLPYRNKELGRILGEVCSVIVRSFDRFDEQESFDRLEGNWEDLISHSQNSVDVSSPITHNLHLDCLIDKDGLHRHLNKPCLSLFLACPLCTSDYIIQRKDLFNLILEKGIPLVLWSRSVDLTDVQKAVLKQKMKGMVMDDTFNQLEQLFKEVKKERTANNKLAIWCDEPERLKELKKFRNLKQRRLRA